LNTQSRLRVLEFDDLYLPERREWTLLDLLSIFRRRSAFLRWSVAVLLLLGTAYCMLTTRRYRATAEIEVQKESPAVFGLENSVTGSTQGADADSLDYSMTLETEAHILQSGALALEVVKDLKLERTTDYFPDRPSGLRIPAWLLFWKKPVEPLSVPLDDAPDRRYVVLRIFASHLKVTPIVGTRLIEISYTDPDPRLAADVVNRLVQALMDYSFQARFNATAQASSWLADQLVGLRRQTEALQEKAIRLQRDTGIFGEGDAHNVVLARLESLNEALIAAESNRILKEAIYKASQSGDPELISGLAGNAAGSVTPAMTNSLCAAILAFFAMQGAIPFIAPNQALESTHSAASGLTLYGGIASQVVVYGSIALLLLSHIQRITRWLGAMQWAIALAILAIASAAWSQFPLLTFRRSLPFAMAGLFGLYLAVCFPVRRQLSILAMTMTALALGTIVLAVCFPKIGLDASPGHHFNWQGVFTQKNACGRAMVLATAALLSIWRLSFARVATLLLFFFVLLMSGSRGAWAIEALLLTVWVWLAVANRIQSRDRLLFFGASASLAAVLVAAVLYHLHQLLTFIGRDVTLSGRTEIWKQAWRFILERPVLGWATLHSGADSKAIPSRSPPLSATSFSTPTTDSSRSGWNWAFPVSFCLR
jgi:capsular polysaccharide biosynthesis protein